MRLPLVFALFGLVLGGCDRPPQSGMGFYLPPGNAEKGKQAFVEQKCTSCHTVAGVDLPAPTAPAAKVVQLGGEVSRVRSYGDLVTSIIYPAHSTSDLLGSAARKSGEKVTMPEVATDLSVAQLVDIATFLAPKYKRVVPTNYGFPPTP